MKKVVLLIFFSFASFNILFGQLQEKIGLLGEKNMSGYIQPLATSLGTAMNSATFSDADIASVWGFSFSVKGMYIFIPSDQQTFTPATPDGYNLNSETATVYGDKGAFISGPNGYLAFPPGINTASLPAVFPQVSASLIGTKVMFRYMPKITLGENDYSFWGAGISHEISRYFPMMPVDISIQALFSGLEISDFVDLSSFAVNAHASKSFGLFLLYGGLQYETSTLEMSYTTIGDANNADPEIQQKSDVNLSVDGDNSFRFTLGAALKVSIFSLNVDYSISSQSVLSTGLNFAF
ncbi:MAG: hypothetical protein K8F36_14765 [Melioribacteraceae bacterium]|nr:hypothetical protein [Melioribacteraceae bacterium]